MEVTSFEDFTFIAAFFAVLIATVVLPFALIRQEEPMTVALKRWGAFIIDVFWGSG